MAAFMQISERKIKNYKERKETRPEDFKKLYCFNSENVEWLASYFLGDNMENRGGALSSVQKMKVFLRYVADPRFPTGVAEDLGVDQSTVSRTIKYVTNKIMEKADDWIKFPVTREEVMEAKQLWQKKFLFPSTIGVIDCTHVRIIKPTEHSDEYINRKGFASINVQATCNANEWFTSVSADWPGSVHDSQILRNSGVFLAMQTIPENALLLGDDRYGISPWLMTPFRNPETPQERRFNLLFTRERVIIERCFEQIKRRFPILQHKVRVKTKNAASLIVCCFVLHNIAKYLHDDELDDEYIEDADPIDILDDVENDENILRQGQLRRQQLAQIIYNMVIDN